MRIFRQRTRHAIARLACIALALVASSLASAEDIDLFSGTGNLAIPNLLIVVDNTANWGSSFPAPTTPQNCGSSQQRSTRYCAIKTALYNAVNALDTSGGGRIRIGLMFFNYNNGKADTAVAPTSLQTGSSDGSFVRFAVRTMDGSGKSALLNVINSLDKSNDQGVGNAQNAMALEEARRYLSGLPVLNGNNTFYSFNAGPQVLDLNATDGSHTTYTSPATNACAQQFIIYISNGPPASADNSAALPLVTAFNGGTAPAVLPWPASVPNSWQSNWMDELAKLMYNADNVASLSGIQPIVTFGLALRDPNNNNDNQNSAVSARYLVQNAALQGGGKYFETTSATQLQNRITAFLAEIQAVNSVFVSATLPVALNISNTYLNQVYMGVFRPDSNVSPRWYGNLKQYKLAYDPGNQGLTLVDTRSRPVVSSKTGFIVPTARSIWTENPTQSVQWWAGSVDFWLNSMRGSPTPSATDLPDGEVVEKGGAAQKLREQYLINSALAGAAGSSDRAVFTCALDNQCNATCGSSPSNFDLATISASNGQCQAKFGASTSTDMSNLINWIRGYNNNGDESGPGNTSAGYATTVRGSVHGDVLHSRPLVIDYGGTTGIIAFYGANDGMLHAVCAGADGASCAGGKYAGQELWAFVAPESFGKFKRLRDQVPIIWMPNLDYTGVSPAPQRRDYFFDGAMSIYHTSTRTVLYVSGRRGGNFIYAFDVTDPTSPTILWKIDNNTTGFSHLAQTWSAPQVGFVRAKGMSNPVLFLGAGYCGGYSGYTGAKPIGVGEDSDAAATSSPTCPTGADGRGVYVVDLGANGASTAPTVLRFFQATYNNGATISDSVAADLAVLDRDGDGYVDRIYAADTGGTLWRMDVDDATVANWNLFKFAVAKQIADGSGQREKFFYRPDVVPTTNFDAVLIGSGDREQPLDTVTNNRFYMFKDFKIGKNAASSPAMTPITSYTNMMNAKTATPAQLLASVSDSTKTGWYYPLLTDGEKVVNAPLTLASTVYFATNRPNASLPVDLACSNLGEARGYAINFATGTPPGNSAATMFIGGGLPPSPTAGVVQVGSSLVPFCIGCGPGANPPAGVPVGGTSPIDPTKIFISPPPTRKKTYWYSNTDQ